MSKLGLPLKFDYRMMALIRELVTKERHRVWMEEKVQNLKYETKQFPTIKEAYKVIIEDCRNPWLRQGLCNLILDEIESVEDQLKAGLSGGVFHCDECDMDVYVLKEESPQNKHFLHLPLWRHLSCGHVVGIRGKPLSIEDQKKLKVPKKWRKVK